MFSLTPRLEPGDQTTLGMGKPFITVSGSAGYSIHRAKARCQWDAVQTASTLPCATADIAHVADCDRLNNNHWLAARFSL